MRGSAFRAASSTFFGVGEFEREPFGVERFELAADDLIEDSDEMGDEERVIEVAVDALETMVTASSLPVDSFSAAADSFLIC